MSNNIVFKILKTYNHSYAYDRHTNSLILLADGEYEELSRVEKMELLPKESSVIKKISGIRTLSTECC